MRQVLEPCVRGVLFGLTPELALQAKGHFLTPARKGSVQGMQGVAQLRPGWHVQALDSTSKRRGNPLPELPLKGSELLRASSRVAVQESNERVAASVRAPVS